MKRLVCVLLCLALLATGSALAEEEMEIFTNEDYRCLYILLEDGTVEIISCMVSDEHLDIPAELDGYCVSKIAGFAIYNDSLISVSIPESVIEVGDITWIQISFDSIDVSDFPDSISPFSMCPKLKSISVSPDHQTLAEIDGVLFSKSDRKLICYPPGILEDMYNIPQGVKSIGCGAFSDCLNLTFVTIPDSVTVIEVAAFSYCSSLTSITIPDSVTKIGIEAFYGCSSLTSITIPDSVTEIGKDAFSDCPNLKLTVPRDSYAAQYCKDNNLNYTYPDANDWLNG